MQFERTHLINGVCVIKHPHPTPPPHFLAPAQARAHRQVWDDTKDILFVMRTNIMYYGLNCFCTLLYAHAHARTHRHPSNLNAAALFCHLMSSRSITVLRMLSII